MERMKPTPAELVELLLAKAGDLRKAGVLLIRLEGLEAQLTPHIEPLPPMGPTPQQMGVVEEPTASINDPLSFGGRPMPTLKRPGQPPPGRT